MSKIRYECRKCKKITDQLERIVTDNLPPNVKVLECTVCGIMGVCLLDNLVTLPDGSWGMCDCVECSDAKL